MILLLVGKIISRNKMETQQENKNTETKQTVAVEEYESPGRFKQKKVEEPTLKYSPFANLKSALTK
jgi:hypothetical protein